MTIKRPKSPLQHQPQREQRSHQPSQGTMMTHSQDHQMDSSDEPQHLQSMSGLGTILTGFYIGLVVVTVLLSSGPLYSWARSRIIDSSPLALAEQIAQSSIETANRSPQQQIATTEGSTENTEVVHAGTVANTLPPINILLMGTDARPGDVEPARTDTMMVVSLHPKDKTVGILSLPRDLWVPIPGQGLTSKINMAYVIGEKQNYHGGGAHLAMDTVSAFIGHPIDYYVRVNFNGFVELVDLIEGIDMTIPHIIHDDAYPTEDYGVELFHLDAGPQHLDGELALKYVRTRNNDDDYSRAGRQQQVIRAIANKVMSADMIPTLIPKLPMLFYTMRSSIDTDIPMAKQLELAQYGGSASVSNIRQLVLDNRYGQETYTEEGAWILLPNREMVNAALQSFFALVPEDSLTNAANSEAAWVRVEVLNGTGQPRIAARTRDVLTAKGWQVVSIDNADRSDYQHTLIIDYGVPLGLIDQLDSDLNLTTAPSRLSMANINASTTAPIDLRIVVGRDFLDNLEESQ